MTDEQKKQTRDRIGLRIYRLRTLKEWSQEELARRAGLQRSHVSRIEAGKYAVTLETVESIAEAFGMTVDIIDEGLKDLAPLKRLM
jgi:transcriptional regulator with XRE-family HTH domain